MNVTDRQENQPKDDKVKEKLNSPEHRRLWIHGEVIPSLDLRPFIGGEFVDALGSEHLDITDPTTGETLARVQLAGKRDAENAISAARKAFDEGPWPKMHPRARASALVKLAELITDNAEELSLLESADVGKAISGVRAWDIPNAAEVFRYYAGWADKICGKTLPDVGHLRLSTYREPVGVCVAIVSWNFPFPCMAWKLAPALAAGCTVVLKAAERAPMSAYYLARLVSEAGIPNGVVNIVTGLGKETGAALVSDPRVDKITFTGDTETAKSIVKLSAPNLPRLTMELGGKSPNVVCEDADLDAAAAAAVGAMFSVAGQDCGAGSRMLVQESIREHFVKKVAELTNLRRLGDALDDQTEQGPQIDQRHLERIDGFVQDAVNEGARVVVGGRKATNLGEFFYAPTILDNMTPSMRATSEEIFGPVGVVIPFATKDDAIRVSNETSYGLTSAIWTSDNTFAERFAKNVRAGTCWINCYGIFDTTAPWGGLKKSGIGRELGVDGLDSFLETKTVVRA